MKRISYILSTVLAAFMICGCEEFEPVFTGKYPEPDEYKYYTDADFAGRLVSIKDLVFRYSVGSPVTITSETVVKGVVTTTDRPGNFYKSFYIQDETGGIEIKVGKNALYNDFLPGQTVYVDCNGLTIGMYGYKSGSYGGMGMVQIGFSDPTGTYETSYLEVPLLIDMHILRGNPAEKVTVEPEIITSASQLPDAKTATQATSKFVGRYVTLKGLKYANEVFCLLYLDSNKDKKSYENRIFLSPSNNADNPTCGITTWAMSKDKMTEYICSGIWDKCKIGSGNSYAQDENGNTLTVADYRGDGNYDALVNGYNGIEKTAYSVSQYFSLGSAEIQIRTSGFCKFCDYEIDPEVLSGDATVDVTGILTIYQGSFQFIVNDITDIVVNK